VVRTCLGCARARFSALLWIKHLPKLKVAHLLSIPAWLGSGVLQMCSLLSADAFSVPISTTPDLQKYFQREASMQGEVSWKPLGFNESRFYDRKAFPFFQVGESPVAPSRTLILRRVLILQLKNWLSPALHALGWEQPSHPWDCSAPAP